MANKNVRQEPGSGGADTNAAHPENWDERKSLMLHSTYEMENLCSLLLRNEHHDGDSYVIKGALIRLRALSRVIMSAIDDDNADLDDMVMTVTGQHREAQA